MDSSELQLEDLETSTETSRYSGRLANRPVEYEKNERLGSPSILNLANSRFEWSELKIWNHPYHITHLNLSQNNLRAVPADVLLPLKSLKMLNLSQNFIDSMWGLHNQYELEYLDISNNWINHVEGLHRCTKLKAIDLAQNQIARVEDLHELALLNNLKVLDLTGNPIADKKAKQLLVKRLLPSGAALAGFDGDEPRRCDRRVPMSASARTYHEHRLGQSTRPEPHVRATSPRFDRSVKIETIKKQINSVRKKFEDRDREILDIARSLPPPLHDRPSPTSNLGPAIVQALKSIKRDTQASVQRIQASRSPNYYVHNSDRKRRVTT